MKSRGASDGFVGQKKRIRNSGPVRPVSQDSHLFPRDKIGESVWTTSEDFNFKY